MDNLFEEGDLFDCDDESILLRLDGLFSQGKLIDLDSTEDDGIRRTRPDWENRDPAADLGSRN